MEQSLLQQGFELMLYGMGTVFVFLVLLVLATSLLSRIVTAIGPAEIQAQDTPASGDSSAQDARHIAAISAAIRSYRERHRSE